MADTIEERLRNHARSFDSLLSLIPAKLYYGEDVSDQWNRKKQTPEQKRAAKMAKLDPDNWKSAKDVMDERSALAKRKRTESDQENPSENSEPLVEPEQPKSVQDKENPKTKKRKIDDEPSSQQPDALLAIDERKKRQAEKKAAKKEKVQKEKEKIKRQKARKQAAKAQSQQEQSVHDDDHGDRMILDEPLASEQIPAEAVEKADAWSTASSSEGAPDILSPPAESGTSSISSLPPSISEQLIQNEALPKQSHQSQFPPSKSISGNTSQELLPQSDIQPQLPPQAQQSEEDREAVRARLASAISSFRSARKADEPATNRPRNRAELLEQRRRKEEVRRQAKKEQRQKAREEAARAEDEEIARRFSPGGSGSLLGSPRSPPTKEEEASLNNFSYGRIQFGDGTEVNSTDTDKIIEHKTKRGPQDVNTALKAAQNKATRIAGLDEQKRKDIEEKDMWLNAKRRAHGERVKDNTSLLKKALKRQESQKKKSEKEWTERKDGIQKSQDIKQKKRADNIAKRKEEKQAHKVGKKGKKVKRPGFEGSFRGRTGGGKKK